MWRAGEANVELGCQNPREGVESTLRRMADGYRSYTRVLSMSRGGAVMETAT
jgi:hypothetical protein